MNETIERQPRHYLLIDFEATCADDGAVPRPQMEIIEIGAVMVDAASLAVVGEFQSFVRPVRHPRLTAFCTRLTSIAQADVDAAPGFAEAAAALKAWRGGYADLVWGSWGDYDRNQLRQDCDFHRVSDPVGAPHHNIKRLFAQREGSGRKFGLDGGVKRVRLDFAGTHHRGIDDARNIARLLPYALGRAEFPRERR